MLERQIDVAPPKKKNTGMIAAIAAVVLLAIIGGVFMMTRKPAQPEPSAPVASTAPAEIPATNTVAPQPIPADQGLLLLSASPWGELDRIVRKSDQQEMPVPSELSTPTRVKLPPGAYSVTVNGPRGPKTFDVQIEAGKPTARNVQTGGVDVDALAEELTNQ